MKDQSYSHYCISDIPLSHAFHQKKPDLAKLYKILYGKEISWDDEVIKNDLTSFCGEIDKKIIAYLKEKCGSETVVGALENFCERFGLTFPEDAVTFKQRVAEIVKQKDIFEKSINNRKE